MEESPQKVDKKDETNKEMDIFDQMEENQKQQQRFPFLAKLLEHTAFNVVVTLFTIYALFGDDIRVIAFDKSADIGFDIITIIVMTTFFFEIVISIFAKPGYIFSFFFWLDLISTASLILDIQMVSTSIGLGGASAKDTAQLARAGRASRVGTKAGRVIRLVRLIRIVKLYKAASKQNKKTQPGSQVKRTKTMKKKDKHRAMLEKLQQETMKENSNEQDPYENLKESRVSKRLSDLTTKRVIIIVLLLLLVMPFFSADYFYDPPKTLDFSLTLLKDISEIDSTKDQISQTYDQIKEEHQGIESPLAYLITPMKYLEIYQTDEYDILRDDEKDPSSYSLDVDKYNQFHDSSDIDEKRGLDLYGVLSLKSVQIKKSILQLLRTVFVCIVLTLGALLFSKDANDLALRPIERMIEKVKQIAKNPITATEQELVKEGGQDQYETVLIENAIIKIGTLLALGFGDAGSEIIAQNMARSGDVDPMLPGKKKCGIYGFCDIRNFTDATEVLQEDVMIFVNNIAEIVHSMVDRYQGAANKNIGDAFLLVWKIGEDKYQINEQGIIEWKNLSYLAKLADCSVISFLKILAKINREQTILKYREDQRLQKRMKGYKVKMGFGLHIGWGIEGAIGSEFKIDASYLSPNVNLASRLEAATKQYGVPLLISHQLENVCSDAMKVYTRQIDNVTVKGSRQPMGLYTIDCETEDLPPSKDPQQSDQKERQLLMKVKKKEIKEKIEKGDFSTEEIIKENKDLKLLLNVHNPDFLRQWAIGFDKYLKGDWGQAKIDILAAQQICPNDGPCKTILDVLQDSHFSAPTDWPGYRELTEK